MCGIVGYAGFTKKILIDKSVAAIKHRGPDGNGCEYFSGVALGNTRLAILDLSEKGHQPMFNKDKSLCITFNGEIYNFQEVKKILEKKYTFHSNTDTETIIYAYQEWGEKCVQKLNGMFSFVIYDKKKNVLFGARDRLGQKPLKYFFDNKKFIFGSEIKAMLPLVDSSLEVDEVAIDDFLTLQYVPSPRTGFKNIYKLPPAHYFLYKNNTLKIERYWSLDFTHKLRFTSEEWEDLVFSEIKDAVKSHLISDVPVGALLSGGLDSSLIVALMSLFTSQKINTFSIGFDDDEFDETPYAMMVSKLYKTNHTQLYIKSNELAKNIQNIADVYDEPIGDNSILPTMIVTNLASDKVKVALTGDGGDENFAGYDRYTFVSLANYIAKSPSHIKKLLGLQGKVAYSLSPNKKTERIKRFLLSLQDTFYRRYVSYNSFFTNETKNNLYTADFKEKIKRNDTFEIFKSFYNSGLNDLDNALNIDTQTYLPDDLLYKTDSASMANGLELRSPFLDHKLMEKVASMPADMKLKFTTKKKILKDIAYKNNLLPKELIYRQKHGFTIPQNKWFKGSLKPFITKTILSSSMIGTVFDKEKMETYLDNYFKTNLNYDNNIFALLMLSLWFNKYHK